MVIMTSWLCTIKRRRPYIDPWRTQWVIYFGWYCSSQTCYHNTSILISKSDGQKSEEKSILCFVLGQWPCSFIREIKSTIVRLFYARFRNPYWSVFTWVQFRKETCSSEKIHAQRLLYLKPLKHSCLPVLLAGTGPDPPPHSTHTHFFSGPILGKLFQGKFFQGKFFKGQFFQRKFFQGKFFQVKFFQNWAETRGYNHLICGF